MEIKEILKNQNLEKLKYAIEKGLDVSKIKVINFLEEVEELDLDFFQFLINSGIDIEEKDEDGAGLSSYIISDFDFIFIIENGLTKKYIEIINFIIKNDIDIDSLLTDMIFIEEIKFISILLDKKTNLNDNILNLLFIILMPKKIALKSIYEIEVNSKWTNKKEIIKLFVDNGFNLNMKLDNKLPLLALACLISDIETIQILIDNGANINIQFKGISLFGIILMMNKKFFELTLFNQKNSFDISFLFSNFEKNKIKILKLFIENGIDINKERIKELPLLVMFSLKKPFLFQKFSNELNINLIKKELFQTFMNYFSSKDINIIKFLLENGADINIRDNEGMTPLIFTSISNNIEITQLLCEYGADVNIRDNYGETSLLFACRENNTQMVELLCKYGADVNIRDNYGVIPLLSACRKNNIQIVELLCKYGADVNIRNNYGTTALLSACQKNNTQIVELLCKYGANVNLKFDNGFHVGFYLDKKDKDIRKILIKYGLDTSSRFLKYRWKKDIFKGIKNSEEREKLIKLEKNHKKNLKSIKKFLVKSIEEISKKRFTPMTNILKTKDIKELKRLIKSGYDTSFTNIYDLIYLDYPIEFIELLLRNGNNPNIVNSKDNSTPLLLAVKKDNLELVELLVKYGANTNFKTKSGNEIWEFTYNEKINDILLNPNKYFKENYYQPKKLINLLKNFTKDTPIKYSTHLWDFGSLKDEYGDFNGFINAISKQLNFIEKNIEKLSPKLHRKIYDFLLNKNPTKSWCSKANITIGWSSLEGLEDWCNSGKNPFDFELKESIIINNNQTITTFGEVINLFKQEIEIRNDNNMLENIFLAQKRKLGRSFKIELIKLKGRSFYTDVESFTNSIDRIFEEIKKRDNHKNIRVEVIEVNDNAIEIVITQLGSKANRSAKEMIDEVKDGDFKMIKDNLQNLCDWSIESSFENKSYRVTYLPEIKQEDIKTSLDDFKHVLRFYK